MPTPQSKCRPQSNIRALQRPQWARTCSWAVAHTVLQWDKWLSHVLVTEASLSRASSSRPPRVGPTAKNAHIIRFIIAGNLHQGRRERPQLKASGSSSRRQCCPCSRHPGKWKVDSRTSAPEPRPDRSPGYASPSLQLAYAIANLRPFRGAVLQLPELHDGRNRQSAPDNWHDWRGLLIIDDAHRTYEYTSFWNDLIGHRRPGEGPILALFSSYESPSRKLPPLQIPRSDV